MKNKGFRLLILGVFIFIGFFSCKYDNAESLLEEVSLQDSLINKIPTINITSPNSGDTVETPFTINYKIEKWEIEQGGKHLQYFINGENKGLHYGTSSLVLSQADTGNISITLELARFDFSLTGVFDSVQVYVKPPPPATYPLIVDFGEGSGNYAEGQLVPISANIPEGKIFDQWLGDIFVLDQANSPTPTVTMPAQQVNIEATFQEKPIDFAADIFPIFQNNCLNCHDGINSPTLSTCEDASTATAKIKERIIDADNPMPPAGLMSQENIDLINKWIDQGANCN